MAGNVIKHCAPTLAGLKVANAFSYRCKSKSHAQRIVSALNAKLNTKGVFVKLLRFKDGRSLYYVYRDSLLKKLLSSSNVRDFLKDYGYENFDTKYCVHTLNNRLEQCDDFPHEIGIFLGYPLEDIKSFICNSGNNALCVGCWKVYHDVDVAQKTFCKYNKCKKIYMQKYACGVDIVKLTVAC